ncbi:SDR family oxidoreductase [soil metagenome]
MKRVLVTGGCGYVGGAVVDALVAMGHEVRVYDVLLYEEQYRKRVPFVRGDVRDVAKLAEQLEWADCVVWLAAVVGDGACALNPEMTVELNFKSVEWLRQHFDGRIVFASTCSVYGAQDGELVETSTTNPLSLYAATKIQAETALAGSDAVSFRLGTLFGVGDEFSRIRLDLVVNTLTVRAHEEGRVSVFGGDQFRPLLHVKDAAAAFANAVDQTNRGVYNLTAKNTRIIDIAYQIRGHFPDCTIEQSEAMFQDTRNYRVSAALAIKEVGFRPRYSLDDGIEEIKQLVQEGRIRDTGLDRYSNLAYLSALLKRESSALSFREAGALVG